MEKEFFCLDKNFSYSIPIKEERQAKYSLRDNTSINFEKVDKDSLWDCVLRQRGLFSWGQNSTWR